MRTKTCKAITDHFLNGGRLNNYKGDIVLADGTTLTYADWMGKNTDSAQRDRFIMIRSPQASQMSKPLYLYGAKDSILWRYLFPFSNGLYAMSSTATFPTNTIFQYSYRMTGNYNSREPEQCNIYFGSDATEESEDDYALKMGLDNVGLVSTTYGSTYDNYVTLTVKNWKEEEIVIKELGSFIDITYAVNTPVSENIAATNTIMLARLVLNNPVTIAAGETGQIYIK